MLKTVMVVFWLYLVMACAVFVRETKVNIEYEAIGKVYAIQCAPNNRENCKEGPPANEFQRGYNAMNCYCDGNDKKEDDEEDEKEDDKN
ncbi:hypothetical protein ACOSQ3_002815 [Xanthoceras sorbifolium]